MAVAKVLKLNTGALMPALGFGTYLGQGDKLAAALDFALHVGYRHIDTAYRYDNHKVIGDVLSAAIKSGRIKREDIFLTTKVPGKDLTTNGVPLVLEESLEDLKLQYVDLLLAHTPFGYANATESGKFDLVDNDIVAGWKAMEKEHQAGKAKAIGASNFTAKQLDMLVSKGKIEPANLQTECHAYLLQRQLRQYCLQMGVVMTAYGPLGAPGRPAIRKNDDEPLTLLMNPVILDIAEQVNKTPSQVLLRYLIQLGVAPLPKSVTNSRIEENFQLFDWRLSGNDENRIKQLNADYKYFNFEFARGHKNFPKDGEPF